MCFRGALEVPLLKTMIFIFGNLNMIMVVRTDLFSREQTDTD